MMLTSKCFCAIYGINIFVRYLKHFLNTNGFDFYFVVLFLQLPFLFGQTLFHFRHVFQPFFQFFFPFFQLLKILLHFHSGLYQVGSRTGVQFQYRLEPVSFRSHFKTFFGQFPLLVHDRRTDRLTGARKKNPKLIHVPYITFLFNTGQKHLVISQYSFKLKKGFFILA